MPDRDSYPYPGGSRLQPLKRRSLPRHASPTKMNIKDLLPWAVKKFALPLLGALRAGLKNWITTLIGVAMIILGIFDGAEPSIEAITAGVALIFARDAGKSSQDSGIRPEIIE